MEKEFEVLEHTADVGIRSFGPDLKAVFANAAKGMFSLITDLDKVEESLSRNVEVRGTDRDILLVEWLNELVYLFDVNHVLFRRFEIYHLSNTQLKARCYGEKVDRSKHDLKVAIKAATLHMLEIKVDDGYIAQVLFDI
jgi:SHS2 domain-containing protein